MSDPFEVYGVSKADRKAPKGYRSSHLRGFNPRSDTFVKEGTSGRRAVRFVGGSMAGGVVGSAVGSVAGSKLGNPRVGGTVGEMAGAATGATLGRTQNVRSGDTKSYQRSTGKKAKGGYTVPGVGSFMKY